jgi:hypothetical protein
MFNWMCENWCITDHATAVCHSNGVHRLQLQVTHSGICILQKEIKVYIE